MISMFTSDSQHPPRSRHAVHLGVDSTLWVNLTMCIYFANFVLPELQNGTHNKSHISNELCLKNIILFKLMVLFIVYRRNKQIFSAKSNIEQLYNGRSKDLLVFIINNQLIFTFQTKKARTSRGMWFIFHECFFLFINAN